jgi:hypothetical protein
MYQTLVFLMAFNVAGAADPGGAAFLWTAEDQSLTMEAPADVEGGLESLRSTPERLLAPFLAMMGVADSDAQVTEQGLSSVREDVAFERVIVGGEACHRRVKRRSEVLLDFTGLLSRTDLEEYGQAYNIAQGTPCDLAAAAYSSVSFLPGTWLGAEHLMAK